MKAFFSYNKFKIGIYIAVLTLLFLLSDGIRTASYSSVPEPNGILDERTNVWSGLSIRQTGVPAAWTELSIYRDIWALKYKSDLPQITQYGFNYEADSQPVSLKNYSNYPKPVYSVQNFDFTGENRYYTMVQPYLDHPPLGGLILSSMVSENIKDFASLTPREFRRTSLVLANITFILIFVFGWIVFKNPVAGILSATIYGFTPTFLLTSRYALLENILIPLSIAVFIVLYLTQTYAKKRNLQHMLLITASILAGLAILVKVSGIYILIGALIFLYLKKTPFKTLMIFSAGSLLIGSLYLVWGLYLLPEYFFQILYFQGASRVFSGSLASVLNIFKFGIAGFPVDGWWIGGFLSIPLLLKAKEHYHLGIISITSLFILLFLGAGAFPWYFMIFIPFMCIAVTHLILQIYQKPTIELLLLFFVVFFMSSFFWGFIALSYDSNFQNSQLSFFVFRIILVITTILIFLLPKVVTITDSPHKKKWQICWSIILLICLKLNFTSFIFMLSNWSFITSFFTLNWKF